MTMADLKPIHEPNAGDKAWEIASKMKLQQTEPKSTKVDPADVEQAAPANPDETQPPG
jgi:hypothetical protein